MILKYEHSSGPQSPLSWKSACLPRYLPSSPPWRQFDGSLVNFHANATRIGWHLWEIGLKFASGSPDVHTDQSDGSPSVPGIQPACQGTYRFHVFLSSSLVLSSLELSHTKVYES